MKTSQLLLIGTLALWHAGNSGAADRIAILGCHRQDLPAPALVKVVEAKPEICIWIGDNVYADTQDDPSYIQHCYEAMEAKPAFRQLREHSTFLATWDDHDFGLNDVGGKYRWKRESKEIFRKFWRLEEEIPADQPGIYYSKSIESLHGVLQIVLLDPRYNRDDPGPNADTLGEPQWVWLEKTLQQPADLRLIVSGYQILLDTGTGSETWAEFPKARQRLFDLIKKTEAEHVVFLTGDQHYGEVCRLPGAIGYDAIELQFAGVNQIEEPELNTTRVSQVSTSYHSYALLDIQWQKSEHHVPHLDFQIIDAEVNRPDVTYRVNFHELTLPK